MQDNYIMEINNMFAKLDDRRRVSMAFYLSFDIVYFFIIYLLIIKLMQRATNTNIFDLYLIFHSIVIFIVSFRFLHSKIFSNFVYFILYSEI